MRNRQQNWREQVNLILTQALSLEGKEREEYVCDACGSDESLREEVCSLLANLRHAEEMGFLGQEENTDEQIHDKTHDLDAHSVRLPKDFQSVLEEESLPPGGHLLDDSNHVVIERYRLVERLGEGGMGLVFRADQQSPVRRSVALKIIKPGMDSKQVIARFEAERQALAMMDHENIARILDAGTTENGRPFFVMDLVQGIPITDFCNNRKLGIRERMELFISVCQAVQHAHHKGIIHRDLKPSNILVTDQSGRAVPKVIDFGIAKAIGTRLSKNTLFTRIGQLLGTFEYMSPEQSEMNQLDVDTRSDVYSLGVLAYELLTGTTPIPKNQIKSLDLENILRTIRSHDPPKPSIRLVDASCHPNIEFDYANRTKVAKVFRGDLDWIVMKALEKDRNRRYQAANRLADDVKRYLSGEPTEASSPSTFYQLKKFASRHKIALTSTIAFLIVMMAATSVSLYFAFWAMHQQEIAEGRFREVELERQSKQNALDLAEDRLRIIENANGRLKESEKYSRQIIDTFYTRVSENTLMNQPGMLPLRQELLIDAKDFYESFALDNSDVPELLEELGLAWFRIARILAITGNADQATDWHEAGDAILAALDNAKSYQEQLPQSDLRKRQLSNTWQQIAKMQMGIRQDLVAASEAYDLAYQLRESVRSQEATESANDQRFLANLLVDKASLASQKKDLNSSLKFLEASESIRDEIMRTHQVTAALLSEQGKCYYRLADLLRRFRSSSHRERALKYARRSVEVLEKVNQQSPNDFNHQILLGMAYASLARSERSQTASKTALQNALKTRRRLETANPEVPHYKFDVANTLSFLASFPVNENESEQSHASVRMMLEAADRYFVLAKQNFRTAMATARLDDLTVRLCAFLATIDAKRFDDLIGEAIETYSNVIEHDLPIQRAKHVVAIGHYRRAFAIHEGKDYKKALELYKLAMSFDPNLLYFDCFNAACAAVSLAEEGARNETLPVADGLELKRQAMRWLEQSLERYLVNFKTNPQAIQNALLVWRDDKDLASVRDPDHLKQLDDSLRKSCESFWTKLDQLIKDMN